MKQFWLTARLDIVESLRARWFQVYTLVFGGIVALLFLFGLTESRVLGFIGLSRLLVTYIQLTMAILPSLLIVIEGDVFAIPVESVVEIVRIPNSEVGTVHGQRTARVRDRVVSVIELNDVFTWNQSNEREPAASGDQTLVIVGVEGSELGLRVDALLGEQDVVIKSLEENFQNVAGVAGASILGDGRVSLILDVGSLLTMAQRGTRTAELEEVVAV